MIIKSIELDQVAGPSSSLKGHKELEIAFAGRSNVGKSTLLNKLAGRKNYARVSSKPGKTRTINFYRVNDEFYYVDLPGYGYAKAGNHEVEKWGKLIEKYLGSSKSLRMIILLVDSRHTPNANDRQMYEWCLYYGFNPLIIATKADKLKRSERAARIRDIKNALDLSDESPVILYSAVDRQGVDEINEYIDQVVEAYREGRL